MLEINIEPKRGILFVRLNGDLTKRSKNKLKNEVSSLIKAVGIKNIVFNLTNLDGLDNYGVKELLANVKYCEKNNGKAYFITQKHRNLLKKNLLNDEQEATELINV